MTGSHMESYHNAGSRNRFCFRKHHRQLHSRPTAMTMKPQASAGVRRRARRTRQLESTRTATWCEALLGVTVLGSVLAIGTVHVRVLLTVAAIAFVGGALSLLSFRRPPIPAVVLASLGIFSLLQAVPLPASWVVHLSPIAAQVWLHCLDPFQEHAPSRFSISLDRGASIAEALKWFTYAAVYVMAARVRLRRGTAWLAALIFISSAIVSVLTLWHGASNLRLLYGVYEPTFAVNRWNVGPLLNSNNFAGYAILGLFSGVGLMLSRSRSLPALPSLLGLAMILTALLLSGSRAAIACTVLSGIGCAVWLVKRQGVQLSVLRLAAAGSPVLFAALTFAVVSGSGEWQALGPGNFERKAAVWRWSLPMIRDYAWLGVGRGAFETAFPRYHGTLSHTWTSVTSHAENFVIQWLAEWGLPVGAFALVVIVGYIVRDWHGARNERLRFVLLTGVITLLVQNLADLGLELPSLMIAAVVAVAAGERPQRRCAPPAGSAALIGAVGALSVFGIVWLAASAWSRSPVEDERREVSMSYRALDLSDSGEQAAFRMQLHGAMLRHPGEVHFPLLGALLALRTGETPPLRWLGRALELGPTDARAHLVLADVLRSHRATTQAMIHLRMAAEYDATLGGAAATRLAQWAPSLDVLKQGIPRGSNGAAVLSAACESVPAAELKISCFRYAMTVSPKDPKLPGHVAEALLESIRAKTAPCSEAQTQRCFAEVDQAAHAMAKLDPKAWQVSYLIARNFEAQGDFKSAAEILANACPAGAEGQQCVQDSVAAAIASKSDAVILSAADVYAARACASTTSCATAMDALGTALDAGGKGVLAINYFTRAAEAESSADRWLHIAERAAALQLPGIALSAIGRADRSPDATANTRAETSRLRMRIVRSSLLAPSEAGIHP
jgi:O-Antigen ligase